MFLELLLYSYQEWKLNQNPGQYSNRLFPKMIISGTCTKAFLLRKCCIIVPNPTCLVRCDVDRGVRGRLVAQVRHCVHGLQTEGVVGVSHQVEHRHPGLRQPTLPGNESNRCRAQTLHHASEPQARPSASLPSTGASGGRRTILTGPSFP